MDELMMLRTVEGVTDWRTEGEEDHWPNWKVENSISDVAAEA